MITIVIVVFTILISFDIFCWCNLALMADCAICLYSAIKNLDLAIFSCLTFSSFINFSLILLYFNKALYASSLLPNSGLLASNGVEGFSDCDVQNVLANQTFLSASGGIIGTDTSAGSLRNANQGLRSDPPNPLQYVGPWNLSTIYPDLLRRPLEGCGPSFGMYGSGEKHNSSVPTPISSGI